MEFTHSISKQIETMKFIYSHGHLEINYATDWTARMGLNRMTAKVEFKPLEDSDILTVSSLFFCNGVINKSTQTHLNREQA